MRNKLYANCNRADRGIPIPVNLKWINDADRCRTSSAVRKKLCKYFSFNPDSDRWKDQAPYDSIKPNPMYFFFQMDFLYKLFSDSNSQAIKVNRKLVYTQISLCCQDASVNKGKAYFLGKESLRLLDWLQFLYSRKTLA